MQKLTLSFPAGMPARGRALAGVVGSGDLEVLVEPGPEGQTCVSVSTSVDGSDAFWQAVLGRILGNGEQPATRMDIHDFGATPGVIRMRIEQVLEELREQDEKQGETVS